MHAVQCKTLSIASDEDVFRAAQLVRRTAAEIGFRKVDQTRVATAASELGRNMVDHAGGGELRLEEIEDGVRTGLRIVFEDHGPGIADVPKALTDGFTTGGGLGLGLGGAKRLVDKFTIESHAGEGTRVSIIQWK